MGRILGVDFGHVRMGLALSDPLNIFATPLPLIEGSKNPKQAARNLVEAIGKLQKERQLTVDFIVLGLPLHLDGSESDRSREVRALAAILEEEFQIKVTLFDERMTTRQAERALLEADLSRKKRARTIDGVSSTILLQSFLDSQTK